MLYTYNIIIIITTFLYCKLAERHFICVLSFYARTHANPCMNSNLSTIK